jgi:hypothetical protein
VVAAIAVTAALAVFVGGMVRGTDERNRIDLDDGYNLPHDVAVASTSSTEEPADDTRYRAAPDEALMSEIESIVPAADHVTVRQAVGMPGSSGTWMQTDPVEQGSPASEPTPWPVGPPMIADDDVLEVFDIPSDVRRLVEADGLVLAGWFQEGEKPDAVIVATPDGTEVTATVVDMSGVPDRLGSLLIDPALVRDLDLDAADSALALDLAEPLTDVQKAELSELTLEMGLSRTANGLDIWTPSDDQSITPLQIDAAWRSRPRCDVVRSRHQPGTCRRREPRGARGPHCRRNPPQRSRPFSRHQSRTARRYGSCPGSTAGARTGGHRRFELG